MSEQYACNRGSNFGCGAYECVSCYPFTYQCEHFIDYIKPIPNGEELPECDHDE